MHIIVFNQADLGTLLLISTQWSMPFGGLEQPLQMERLILHFLLAAVKQIALLRSHTRADWSQDATGHRPDMTLYPFCTTETIKVLLMSLWNLTHEKQPGFLELYWCYCAKCFTHFDKLFVTTISICLEYKSVENLSWWIQTSNVQTNGTYCNAI